MCLSVENFMSWVVRVLKLWLFYEFYGHCSSETQNVTDAKRKCRKAQHPTELDLQGQIHISSLFQREPTCEFQRRIWHSAISLQIDILSVEMRKNISLGNCIQKKVVLCLFLLSLYALSPHPGWRQTPSASQNSYDRELLPFFWFFHAPAVRSSLYRLARDWGPGAEPHTSTTSSASESRRLLLQYHSQWDSRTQAP